MPIRLDPTHYLSKVPGSVVRAGGTKTLPVPVGRPEGKRAFDRPGTVDKFAPKGGSAVAVSKIGGEPIDQLKFSRGLEKRPFQRTQAPKGHVAFPNPWKAGDRATVVGAREIVRTNPVQIARARVSQERLIADAIQKAGPKVKLSRRGLSGLQMYAAPRVKPGLPGGVLGLRAQTNWRPRQTGMEFVDTQIPVGAPVSLDRTGGGKAIPAGVMDDVPVSLNTLRAVVPEPVSPVETPGESMGRVLFLGAAVFVAFMVLR